MLAIFCTCIFLTWGVYTPYSPHLVCLRHCWNLSHATVSLARDRRGRETRQLWKPIRHCDRSHLFADAGVIASLPVSASARKITNIQDWTVCGLGSRTTCWFTRLLYVVLLHLCTGRTNSSKAAYSERSNFSNNPVRPKSAF